MPRLDWLALVHKLKTDYLASKGVFASLTILSKPESSLFGSYEFKFRRLYMHREFDPILGLYLFRMIFPSA